MPLLMTDNMELDMNDLNDLFDDGTGLPLPSQPPPKELFQRVDELRNSGCCQAIAWSKSGCIASIIPGGRGIEFRNLRCHPLDGSWDLSEPEFIHDVYPKLDFCFQHLCWSASGADLAAIDTTGRISMFSIGNYLNHLIHTKYSQTESPDDLNAVVGAYWINIPPAQSRNQPLPCAAIKVNNVYRFELAYNASFGPFYPASQKSGLVCITTNGVLRLVWPQADGTWHETTSEIESIVSSNDLITHASICGDSNQSLLVAFATTSKQLRTVRVFIKWGNKIGDKVAINPSILIIHLAAGNWMDGTWNDAPDSFHVQSSTTILSHLAIIPPTAEGPISEASLPTILTVRSHLPLFPTHFNQDVYSIIDRWELRESTQSIHSTFEQLGAHRRNLITMRKLDGIAVSKIVLHVQSVALDSILCFVYGDGSFEYRERAALAQLFPEPGFERIMHISQAGFSYTDDEPCLQVALSPTSCSFVQVSSDGKWKWKTLSHHMEQLEMLMDEEQYAAVIAAFSLCLSAPAMISVCNDDVLAIVHRYIDKPGLAYNVMKGYAGILKLDADYSGEIHHDTLIRNTALQSCLSMQNSLGYNGDLQPRKFGAKIGWISMQIRNSVVSMSIAATAKLPSPDNPQKRVSGLEDAETIRMLSGSVKWNLDLMSWLVDSLLHPEDPSLFKPLSTQLNFDLNEFNGRLQESNNVAIHILLSSASRGFLNCICKRLSTIDYIARKAMQTAAQSQAALSSAHIAQPLISNNLRAAYTAIATMINSSVIQIRAFESFLAEISTSVRDAYVTAGLPGPAQPPPQQPSNWRADPNTERNAIEKTVIFGGPFPLALVPALRHIFTTLLPTLRSGIDNSRLFFHDFSLLALDPLPSPANSITSSQTLPLGNLNLLGISPQNGYPSAVVNEQIAHTIDMFQRVPVTLGNEPDPGGLKSAIQAANAILQKAMQPSNGDEVPNEAPAGGTPAKLSHGGAGAIASASIASDGVPDRNTVAAAAAALPALQRKAREAKKWRRCVRCASVMAEVPTGRPTLNILVVQQRKCFCAGHWNLLTGKKIVA